MLPAYDTDTHYNSIETRTQIPTDNTPYWLVVGHIYTIVMFMNDMHGVLAW